MEIVRFRNGLYAIRRGDDAAGYGYLALDSEDVWFTREAKLFKEECITSDIERVREILEIKLHGFSDYGIPVDIMIQRIEEDTSPRRISSTPKNRRLLLYWPKCGEHYSGRWYTGEWRHGQFMCDANLEVPVNHHPTYWTELPELPKE